MTDTLHTRRSGPAGTSTNGSDGTLARITAIRDQLPPVGQRIADYVLANATDIIHMSVTELAEAVDVSEGSVVRLCQQIGLKGFQDLKLSLARDLANPVQFFIHEDLQPGDNVDTVVEKILQSDIQALVDTLKVLDRQAMAQAVQMILDAERVEFYGIGSAASVAIDAHYRMLRIGIKCAVLVDSHVQAVSASLTGPDVVTVTISHSGATMETLAATRLAKEAGAKTIVITNYGKSPILAFADVVLHTAARETQFRTESMTSRIAELSIVDALNACVALANHQRSLEYIDRTLAVLSSKRF
ncbi:MAG: MurR/RpiR family transcriptional regulator [Chloroflexota bacterium]|nr:MurR/RpiR family transcriptional regulator [Chloroflexota bacterium]